MIKDLIKVLRYRFVVTKHCPYQFKAFCENYNGIKLIRDEENSNKFYIPWDITSFEAELLANLLNVERSYRMARNRDHLSIHEALEIAGIPVKESSNKRTEKFINFYL